MRVFTVGPNTIERIFKANGISHYAFDIQKVFDAVETQKPYAWEFLLNDETGNTIETTITTREDFSFGVPGVDHDKLFTVQITPLYK